tara:strand:- start:651 stop:884 length:234 start_codon:yes stop_codon:yes gene_type:complete
MPKNTRVYRCVKAVHKQTDKKGKPKYSYGASIAICQASTKQSYKTGKRLYRPRTRRPRTRRPRTGKKNHKTIKNNKK